MLHLTEARADQMIRMEAAAAASSSGVRHILDKEFTQDVKRTLHKDIFHTHIPLLSHYTYSRTHLGVDKLSAPSLSLSLARSLALAPVWAVTGEERALARQIALQKMRSLGTVP